MSSQELPTTQQPETKPEVPSSDAVLPSSPTPVKSEKPNASNEQAAPTSDPPKPEEPAPPTNPRLAALATKQANLEAKLADLQAQRAAFIAEAKLPSGLEMPAEWTEEQRTKQTLNTASGRIKEHIALLHSYNEMKDIGQGLMGLVADKRGVRVAAIMEEFGMEQKD